MIDEHNDGDDRDDNAGSFDDESGKIDHQSVVLKELKWPTCTPALMWRYIGTAITDGEFGVLQSKLNLFQIAPPSPCKPPWGDLWSGGSSQTF